MGIAIDHDDATDPPASPPYQPIMNSNGLEGFLIDAQPRTWREIKQSGLELFVKGFDGKYYNFNIAHDPYFYVLLDEWGSHVPVVKNAIKEKSKLGNWERVKDIQIVKKHVSGTFEDLFRHSKKVLKVITYFPNDIAPKKEFNTKKTIPGVREIVLSIKGVTEWREADVPYHQRAMIDLELNVGKAYRFKIRDGEVHEYADLELDELPQMAVTTFDIEIKKEPVKKPKIGDPINLFGYKYRKTGFMINNVGIHGVEIEDFWMGVKDGVVVALTEEEVRDMKNPQYPPVFFKAINVPDEKSVILTWKNFLREKDPKVIGGYNSDMFDWDQIAGNGKKYNILFDDMFDKDSWEKAYTKDGHLMIDAIKYIDRDSYLSKGNRGLKDASKIKLAIEPLEIDHEETVRLLNKIQKVYTNPEHENYDMDRARHEVQQLAHYCASDVFITATFLEEHIVDLDTGLATILPMTVFETARKARGPMVEAMLLKRMHDLGMIAPNKVKTHGRKNFNPMGEIKKGKEVYQQYTKNEEKLWARTVDKKWMVAHCKGCPEYKNCKPVLLSNPFYKNKRIFCKQINDEIYVAPDGDLPVKRFKFEGGYVKAFNIGVFKDNCPIKFKIDPSSLDTVENKMKAVVLKKARDLKNEGYTVDVKQYIDHVSESFDKIREKCTQLDDGTWEYYGLIIIVHIDVASMYPSIIINWNLQPHGVVNEFICESCPLHHAGDEPCCWVELPWNAVYEVLMLPPSMRTRINGSSPPPDHLTAEQLHDHYEKTMPSAIKGGADKPAKKKNEYKVPMVARFCQKAQKSFVDMVEDFRAERYKYKYGEKFVAKDIEKIRSAWKARMPPDIKQRVDRCNQQIDRLQSRIEDCIMDDAVDEGDFKAIINESLEFKKELKKLLNEWMGKIPGDMQQEINRLKIKKTYNRNAQLTYKVILNAIYGWLKSIGARLWSIEVTGCTTLKGQHIIQWVVDYTKNFSLQLELDSLDYEERLIFKSPGETIRVLSIGKFVDWCVKRNGVNSRNDVRNVDYSMVPDGWDVLSVNDRGNVEWQPVTTAIRQKTDRDIVKVTTPFGSVRTTDSHSIFHNDGGKVEPFLVKNLNDQHVTHACHVPNIQKKYHVNLCKKNPDIELFAYVPVSHGSRWNKYKVSNLRTGAGNGRKRYYKVPIEAFDDTGLEGVTLGKIKGYKFASRIPMTVELAELCGWYVAEGYSGVYNDKIGVGISQKGGDNLERIKELVLEIGKNIRQYKMNPSLDKKSGVYRVAMDNVFFHHLFHVLGCGKDAFKKRIPPIILSSPSDVKEAFLKGYFNGDGSTQGKRRTFYTSSDGLRDDLFVIGKQLGYVVSIKEDFSRTSGKKTYMINFMNRENWERGSRSHYDHVDIGKTIGLQQIGMEMVKKTTDYVYDISVKNNNNFVCANGGILCHNTDGDWIGLPSDMPLEIEIEGINEGGEKKKIAVNLFNSIVNRDVTDAFTNENNYVFNEETGEHECKPQCLIKFDYDGPYSTYFLQRKKRYTTKERDPDDPTRQKVAEVKGMDQKRKGELPIIKKIEREVDKAYEEATSYEQIYSDAIDAVKEIVDTVIKKKMDPEMVYESRDISSVKTAKEVQSVIHGLEVDKKYDPDKIPMAKDIVATSNIDPKVKKKVIKEFSRKSYNNRQTVGCSRLIDIGVSVENGETVQWIVARYPKTTANKIVDGKRETVKVTIPSISQRVVPTIVFDAPVEERDRFLKRWIGIKIPPGIDNEKVMKHLLDWNYYIERIASKVEKIVLIPWKMQRHLTSKRVEAGMEGLEVLLGIKEEKDDDGNGIDLLSFAGKSPATDPGKNSQITATRMKENARKSNKRFIDLKKLL